MAPVPYLLPLMTRGIVEELGDSEMVYLNVWIYFNLIGNTILLPLIVITFLFSKSAKRHPTLVNLCITWIFSGVFSLLLFYARQHVGPEPSLSLCIAQASLLYGIRPMWSVAVLALVYYTIHTLKEESNQSKPPRALPMTLMLSAPYAAQCSFTVAALLLSYQDPTKVSRKHDFLFCSLSHHQLFLATAVFTVTMCGLIIILEGLLAVVICQNWRTRRDAGLQSKLPVPLIARVLLFGIYVIIGLSVSILMVFDIRLPGDIFAATAGTVVFLIFGTQTDVFQAWCFWRKYHSRSLPKPEPKQDISHLSLEIPSTQTPSLDAIFRSARSETSFRWSRQISRTPSQFSTHRHSKHSTKNFKRLHDDAENTDGVEHAVPSDQTVQELQSADSMPHPHVAEVPKGTNRTTPRSEILPQLPMDGLGRPESTRWRRRDDPPRPKGPRKASVSSVKTASEVGSLAMRPTLTATRPVEFVSASHESSRTLSSVDTHSIAPL